MDFKKALHTPDPIFEDILEILRLRNEHENVNSVRNLLFATNLILDYFMDREDDDLKIPVVYFPICNEYSQELCEDFVAIKMGLYTDRDWKECIGNKLSREILNVPSDIKTKKQFKALRDNHKYELNLSKILLRSRKEYVKRGKIIMFSERLQKEHDSYLDANGAYNRKSVNKYWYLNHAINSSTNILNGYSPLSLVSTDDPDSFYDCIVENEGKISNMVVFPSKSPDGRYSEFCANIFQKPYLDDFVGSGCSLKNVFFFCFSRKPYRLRRILDFKQRMRERIQIFEDEFYDFISFTYDESLVLTKHQKDNHRTICIGQKKDEVQEDYETLFDDITNGLYRYVSRRNEMSLCFNDTLKSIYLPKLLYETEADENILSEIFDINARLWRSEANKELWHYVFRSSVYVIVGNDIDEKLLKSVKNILLSNYQATNVSFGTFRDLRGYLAEDGVYKNNINCRKILVLSFRNDYTDSIFHKYPNSFDPFCINSDQQLLEISNYFFMRQYYEWGKYNYGKTIRKVLKSEFRNSQMRPILVDYVKPQKRLPEDTSEEENDRNITRTIQKTKVVFLDNHRQEFFKAELMLYKYGDTIGIAPLSDLADLYESEAKLSIHPLSNLVKRVHAQFIDSQIDKDNRSERLFKEQPSYGLSESEINSDMQLWKILLAKRVEEHGCENVYEEIMSNFIERYKVSYFSFKRWLEPDYGIPRARRVQKFLVEDYLGIRPPYINLIRRIKERTKSDTEE